MSCSVLFILYTTEIDQRLIHLKNKLKKSKNNRFTLVSVITNVIAAINVSLTLHAFLHQPFFFCFFVFYSFFFFNSLSYCETTQVQSAPSGRIKGGAAT